MEPFAIAMCHAIVLSDSERTFRCGPLQTQRSPSEAPRIGRSLRLPKARLPDRSLAGGLNARGLRAVLVADDRLGAILPPVSGDDRRSGAARPPLRASTRLRAQLALQVGARKRHRRIVSRRTHVHAVLSVALYTPASSQDERKIRSAGR